MVDFVHEALAWFSDEYGRKRVPGWMLAVAAIFLAFRFFKTRRNSDAYMRTLRDLDGRLSTMASASATAHFVRNDDPVTQEAWLRMQGDWYALVIEESAGNSWETVASVEFRSLDEMACYLAKHTPFVISDF